MNLPHLAPLKFAKKILNVNDTNAIILCDFLETPSLAMFIEAAAQASSALENSIHKSKIAFLTVAKNIKLLETIRGSIFVIKVTFEVELQNIKQFSFEAFEEKSDTKVVTGYFTIFISKEL